MKTKIKISNNPNTNWENNQIQYPRLISELEAAGVFTDEVLDTLSVECDLSNKEVRQLIDRAQADWDSIKELTK